MRIILVLGYYYIYSQSRFRNHVFLNTIIKSFRKIFTIEKCVLNPILVIAALKLFIDGVRIFIPASEKEIHFQTI